MSNVHYPPLAAAQDIMFAAMMNPKLTTTDDLVKINKEREPIAKEIRAEIIENWEQRRIIKERSIGSKSYSISGEQITIHGDIFENTFTATSVSGLVKFLEMYIK